MLTHQQRGEAGVRDLLGALIEREGRSQGHRWEVNLRSKEENARAVGELCSQREMVVFCYRVKGLSLIHI